MFYFHTVEYYDERNYTFYLYFSLPIFYSIKMYEIILGRGSAAPENLRNTTLNASTVNLYAAADKDCRRT
jgi:hypothetical protein